MDVDSEGPGAKGKERELEKGGELKIKGQAQVERRRSKWDEGRNGNQEDRSELERRENELKEKALRNKVMIELAELATEWQPSV
ncbi:hypothetical protein A0H81_12257 [Grifola frondosa]|uniref:Uncharacterized protein n=1 Tax=Grifola frondosa TaxID=5627 RepID=A0A1C7LTU8_GRIFR|nr:hypothetical protein A0H81_12257 [Grifola frondosa]